MVIVPKKFKNVPIANIDGMDFFANPKVEFKNEKDEVIGAGIIDLNKIKVSSKNVKGLKLSETIEITISNISAGLYPTGNYKIVVNAKEIKGNTNVERKIIFHSVSFPPNNKKAGSKTGVALAAGNKNEYYCII